MENEAKHTTSSRDEILLQYAGTEAARALRYFDEAIRLTTLRREIPVGVVLENQSVLDALRTALHFSANVSKVFWPARGEREASAKALRDMCGIPDDHPLKSRTLRNHVEHMDERLHNWAGDHRRKFLTVETVNHPRAMPLLTPLEDVVYLVYDADTHEVRVPGEAYSIEEMKAAVRDVQQRMSTGWQAIFKRWEAAPPPTA